jgi:hypothetical protein
VATRVVGEHRVLVARQERELRELVHVLARAAEAVEQHDRRPAACRRLLARQEERRREWQAVVGGDLQILAAECAGRPGSDQSDEEDSNKRGKKRCRTTHEAEG